MTDETSFRKGRNLSIISYIIIIFILSGASFSKRGSVAGVFIQFENTSTLTVGAVIYFFFSLLQFLIHTPSPFTVPAIEYLDILAKYPAWVRHVRGRALDKLKEGTLKVDFRQSHSNQRPADVVYAAKPKGGPPVLEDKKLFALKAQVNVVNDTRSEIGSSIVTVRTGVFALCAVLSFFKFLRASESPYTHSLPFLLAAVALLLIGARWADLIG